MKKRLLSFAILFVSLAFVPLCLTSCDDDDDETTTDDDEDDDEEEDEEEVIVVELSDVIDTYVGDVVYSVATELANQATNLYTLLDNVQTNLEAGVLAQSDIDAACDTYLEVHSCWLQSEAWLYGPAYELGVDVHVDSYPFDVSQFADIVSGDDFRSLLEGDMEDAITYLSEDIGDENILGFHAIEFVLFRDGENRTVEDLEGDDAYFSDVAISGDDELSYALAVAGDLRDWACLLEVAWKGDGASSSHQSRCETRGFTTLLDGYDDYYGDMFLAAGDDSDLFDAEIDAVKMLLVDGCSNACELLADEKMGEPYRAAMGSSDSGDEYGADYIESPYSELSFTDFYDIVIGVRNAVYGNVDEEEYEEESVIYYLVAYNEDMADALDDYIDDALDALDDCADYGVDFATMASDPTTYSGGLSLVGDAIDAVEALGDYLSEVSDYIYEYDEANHADEEDE